MKLDPSKRFGMAGWALEIKRTSITRLKLARPCIKVDNPLGLKSKEPRLRDWNKIPNQAWCDSDIKLEIKRTSITRLKQQTRHAHRCHTVRLEIKRTSITRLKLYRWKCILGDCLSLKSKEPRLRDWNMSTTNLERIRLLPWNQKNLDYEIETAALVASQSWRYSPWNQKNLDYEIETQDYQEPCSTVSFRLEIKRTSITRLKQAGIPNSHNSLYAWNQKNLDYEIETRTEYERTETQCRTWNQKNLDYEIETRYEFGVEHQHLILEIKRTSITRLKLVGFTCWTRVSLALKSKEPRLRDWNNM